MEVRPSGHPSLGAEVSIDLQDPRSFSPNTSRQLRDALVQHAVLNIRTGEKPLDAETFERVCSLLGEIKSFTGEGIDGKTLRYSPDMQIVDAGLTPADRAKGDRNTSGKLTVGGKHKGSWEFHSDDSFMIRPGRFTCLHPQELPQSGGGDTGFLDMRKAWNELPQVLKEEVEGLSAVHHYNNENLFTDIAGKALAGLPGNNLPDAIHPLVRRVPETGTRALYLNLNRMKGIVGLDLPKAKELLQTLQTHSEGSSQEYRHKWRHGDIVIWDNAQVQHRAHDDFPLDEARRMIRFMVGSEAPID